MSSPIANGVTPAFPDRLALLRDRTWQQIVLGRSDAAVWRIEGGGESLFLKAAPAHPLSEMPGEVRRLEWLASTPINAPHIRDAFEAESRHWLLMTALPGRDLTHFTDRPDELCGVLATALRQLHAIDPDTCPFDQRLQVKLATGAAYTAAGLVDETDFGEAHDGWTARAVLEWLQLHRPTTEDLVVCHGDATLPNIMADDHGFAGVVDCGRFGVADRWQDLTLACRSIIYNCGEAHVPTFLAAYGADWDEQRYRYYNALDELF